MCSERHAEHIFIAFSAGSERMQKEAAAADDRVDQGSLLAACGACAIDRCEISKEHGPGVASDLLRGGLGGPGLGLDVLEACAPSAALLLLVGHDFPELFPVGARRGLASTWLTRPSRVDLEGPSSLKPPRLVCIRAPYSRISAHTPARA